VIVFSGPRGCVSMIQLYVDINIVMSACSNESSPLQFTMMGLLSSKPHMIRRLCSSASIEEEGRGSEAGFAYVHLCSENVHGSA